MGRRGKCKKTKGDCIKLCVPGTLIYQLHYTLFPLTNSLAKREMLLAANESLIGTPQKHFQDTLHGFQRTKTRNDQLIKVR